MVARARARGELRRFRLAVFRDGGPPQYLDFRTARHPSESPQHLVARVLAFGLEARPGLALRFRAGGVSTGDEPALAARTAGGALRLAVEIGSPDSRRLARLRRRAAEVVVYCHRDPRPLRRALARMEARGARIRVHLLPAEFVEGLAASLEGDNRWEIEVAGDTLEVTRRPVGGSEPPASLAGRMAPLELPAPG